MVALLKDSLSKRHIAIPQDHGSWVFLLSPLLIGLFAGGRWTPASGFVVIAALAVFLIRQPITIAVKVSAGRRNRRDLSPSVFWIGIYILIGLVGLAGLAVQGFLYLLLLALPGVPVFIWYLYLIRRRSERRQIGVEIVASGVLALAAPAAFWVARDKPGALGWLLWGATWLQSAASIVHAYMRLQQRGLASKPDLSDRLRIGQRALVYTTFNLVAVGVLSTTRIFPPLLFIPYLVQWIESLWGTLNPAIGMNPTRIGLRQLLISSLFTLIFIAAWNY